MRFRQKIIEMVQFIPFFFEHTQTHKLCPRQLTSSHIFEGEHRTQNVFVCRQDITSALTTLEADINETPGSKKNDPKQEICRQIHQQMMKLSPKARAIAL